MAGLGNVPPLKECFEDVEYVVIGAGLPRTGTLSTYLALEKLLPGKCHHMVRGFKGENDPEFFTRASRGELVDDDWKAFIRSESLSASVDYPMSLYWKDLARIYPNAKVLLTVRDPVKWYLSVKNTVRSILRFMTESTLALPIRFLNGIRRYDPSIAARYTCDAPTYLGAKYPRGMFGAIDGGQETAVRFFNDWNALVKKEIPADKLLVFEVRSGWEPLCKFLGVPVPDEPFPNANDTAEQQARLRGAKMFCVGLWSLTIAGIAAAGYFLQSKVPIPKITWS